MNELLKNVIYWIYGIVGNYGWSIVLFTLLIRLITMPFDYRSRVGMRKMSTLQPQIAALQAKYGKDQEKLNRKMSELYKKERVSPLSSCLPMLITLPLLWIMFSAMRMVANENIAAQVFDILQGKEVTMEPWLWVRNVWMADSPFRSVLPDFNSLRMITDSNTWLNAYNAVIAAGGTLPEELALSAESFAGANLNATIQTIYDAMAKMPVYTEMTATMPGWPELNFWIARVNLMKHYNGFFILPILAAVTQVLMTVLQPQQPTAATTQANQQSQATGKIMKWFFPIFSLWICAGYNACFAIYWVASNIIAAIQTYGINKYLDAKDRNNTDKAVTEGGSLK